MRSGDFDFVLEGMASEGGVIRLDIKFKIFFEAVGAEEGDSTGDIEIVLVFGRLFRFRLDEELAFEPDALRVIESEMQKSSQKKVLSQSKVAHKSMYTYTYIYMHLYVSCTVRKNK